MDYPSPRWDLASTYKDMRARPNRRRDRNGLSNHRRFPSHHREPTSDNNDAVRNSAEPTLFSTDSNNREPDASPNRNHPTL